MFAFWFWKNTSAWRDLPLWLSVAIRIFYINPIQPITWKKTNYYGLSLLLCFNLVDTMWKRRFWRQQRKSIRAYKMVDWTWTQPNLEYSTNRHNRAVTTYPTISKPVKTTALASYLKVRFICNSLFIAESRLDSKGAPAFFIGKKVFKKLCLFG